MQKSQTSVKSEPKVVLAPDTEFLRNFTPTSNEAEQKRPQRIVQRTTVRQEVIPPVTPAAPIQSTRNPSPKLNPKTSANPVHRETSKPTVETPERKNAEKKIEITSEKPEKEAVVSIESKKTNNTLNFLIKRFNETRDPKLAAYIAQSFFKKGNYKETVRWSIIANSLEPSNEASWILFAKAKMKLGQKEDAVRALKIYLNQYPSRKVRSYLETLESGL